MSYLFEFAERWLGGLTGAMFTFAGFFLCILVIGAFWDKRLGLVEFVLLLFFGIVLAFFSLFNELFGVNMTPGLFAVLFSVGLLSTLAAIWCYRTTNHLNIGRVSGQKSRKGPLLSTERARVIRGTRLGAPLAILVSVCAVLYTGLSAPQVMIGDEVTHYYMLAHQAVDLSRPNFFAEIPMAAGEPETRRYPHSFFWHYCGAIIYALTNGSFAAIQVYQGFFFLQLLGVAYLLARDRQGVESRSALAYVLVLGSLPLSLIFSVAFYQDVPLTAQILTAFYCLRRGRWLVASLFLSLAIGLKVTAVLFYPAFFLLLIAWQVQRSGWLKGSLACCCALLIVLGSTWFVGRAVVTYGQAEFYPQARMEKVLKTTKESMVTHLPLLSKTLGIDQVNTSLSARPDTSGEIREDSPTVIANHPGDLRITENYLVYGGIVLWLIVGYVLIAKIFYKVSPPGYCLKCRQSSLWLYFVGGSYTLLAAWFIRTSPDARFFLPGLPFLLLPFLEKAVCLPKPKVFITILATLALLQGSYVLQKTYKLRALSPALQEGIRFLAENPPNGRIFMYPEGNYRFFSAQHEWYLGYRLRDFWRADNAKRKEMLNRFGVSAVVIKKYLVAPVDDQITNLGVYPIEFVDDIQRDTSFLKGFENDALLIYFLLPLQKE